MTPLFTELDALLAATVAREMVVCAGGFLYKTGPFQPRIQYCRHQARVQWHVDVLLFLPLRAAPTGTRSQ